MKDFVKESQNSAQRGGRMGYEKAGHYSATSPAVLCLILQAGRLVLH